MKRRRGTVAADTPSAAAAGASTETETERATAGAGVARQAVAAAGVRGQERKRRRGVEERGEEREGSVAGAGGGAALILIDLGCLHGEGKGEDMVFAVWMQRMLLCFPSCCFPLLRAPSADEADVAAVPPFTIYFHFVEFGIF
jgi:hypothetical protein